MMKRIIGKVKIFVNYIYRILVAIFLVTFMIYVFLSLFSEEALLDPKVINQISLIVIILSLPGITDQIAKTIKPESNSKKITCKCPNCKHLVVLEFNEKE